MVEAKPGAEPCLHSVTRLPGVTGVVGFVCTLRTEPARQLCFSRMLSYRPASGPTLLTRASKAGRFSCMLPHRPSSSTSFTETAKH